MKRSQPAAPVRFSFHYWPGVKRCHLFITSIALPCAKVLFSVFFLWGSKSALLICACRCCCAAICTRKSGITVGKKTGHTPCCRISSSTNCFLSMMHCTISCAMRSVRTEYWWPLTAGQRSHGTRHKLETTTPQGWKERPGGGSPPPPRRWGGWVDPPQEKFPRRRRKISTRKSAP